MPRLTRTQKFAGLREQLANDKEEKIISNDLSQYQNRLNNLQDTLSFSTQEFKEEPVIKEVPIEDSKYTWTQFESDSLSQKVTPVEEAPVMKEVKQESSFFNSFISAPVEETKPNQEFKSYFENVNTNSEVFHDVSDDSGEIISQKERDTYLNQTLTDVFSYNEQSGEDTINTILDNSVDEIRHPETKTEPIEDTESIEVVEEESIKNEAPVEDAIDNTYWRPFVESEELDIDKIEDNVELQIDDEEFSNTVSMEITKIMGELANAVEPEAQETVIETIEEPAAEEEKAEEVIEEAQEETVEINRAFEEEKPEEVVEIKNITEVQKEVQEEKEKETMSNTIPFIVNTDEEELEEDDEEEDGSNTVLNVILIVLIVVLVAVLGLIVFYILKTKGIF